MDKFLFLTVAGFINAFGVTVFLSPVKGGYSNNEKTVIYFVVNRFQLSKMKDIVHTIDPHAFLTISEVADVFSGVQQE